MENRKTRVCPVERAAGLDSKIRRWFQNPRNILSPHIKEGFTALDLGCGPGFFTIDIAELVGQSGRVIAADLQEGMLEKLRAKIHGTEFEGRIVLHQCNERNIGVSEKIDFVLAFYMVHEIPDQESFFNEIHTILKPFGKILIVEPPFHVSRRAFEATVKKAAHSGLIPVSKPSVFLSKAIVLEKNP
jgi:ubiquinone/menaquinone biosynthesis C-methylase UbiE